MCHLIETAAHVADAVFTEVRKSTILRVSCYGKTLKLLIINDRRKVKQLDEHKYSIFIMSYDLAYECYG